MTAEGTELVDKLREVQTAVDEEDYGAAVTLCEAVLSLLKVEDNQDNNAALMATVHEIYVKSLLHQKEFEKALGLTPPRKECRAGLEALQAYAAYRLGQYDHKILQESNKQKDWMASHIRAQTHFKKSETQKALEAYQQLMDKYNSSTEEKEEDDDFLMEAYTNAMAVLTANATPYEPGGLNDAPSAMRDKARQFLEDQQSEFPYDLAYNVASLDLLQADAVPDRQEAMGLLKQAVRECKETNSEEETKQELEPMELNLYWGKTFWGEEVPPTATTPCSSIVNFMLKNQINLVLVDGQNSNKKASEKTIQSLQSLLKLPQGKINALQKRLCVYNMAVLQLQIEDYNAARQTLDALQKSLSSNKKSNKKQKASAVGTDVPPPASEAESLWWKARVDVLTAYSYYLPKEEEADTSKQLEAAIQKLKGHLEKATSLPADSSMRDHLVLYLELHMQQLTAANGLSADEQFQWLQEQQKSKSYPATTATLAKAYQDRQQPNKAKDLLLTSNSGGDDGNQIIAEMAMAQENYDEAIRIYEQADASNHEARARLVVALSHVDPQRAMKEWKSLVSEGLQPEEDGEVVEEEDGETLERRELPRIKHTAVSEALATGTTTGSSDQKKNKKSQESILRRREKQRKAHLAKLQERGLYNAARPVQPDPERWIPKHERQKRRRRGGNQSKASQGGVSAKDAAKLDVAARANAEPDALAGPSTAHLTVAGGARKGGRRR